MKSKKAKKANAFSENQKKAVMAIKDRQRGNWRRFENNLFIFCDRKSIGNRILFQKADLSHSEQIRMSASPV